MQIHVFRLFQVVRDYPTESEDKGENSSWAKPIRNNRVKKIAKGNDYLVSI